MVLKNIRRRWANRCAAAGALMGISLPASAQEIRRPTKSEHTVTADNELTVSRVGQAGNVASNTPAGPTSISPQGNSTANAADLQSVALLSRNLGKETRDNSPSGQANLAAIRSLAAKPTLASDSSLGISHVASLGQTHVAAPSLARTQNLPDIQSGTSSDNLGRNIVDTPIPPRSAKP